jgi:hypothetical protein
MQIYGGENAMTVASQFKTAVASLKSAQAGFEQFALNTQNQHRHGLLSAPSMGDISRVQVRNG